MTMMRLWYTGGRIVQDRLGTQGGLKNFVLRAKFLKSEIVKEKNDSGRIRHCPIILDSFPISILEQLKGMTTLKIIVKNDPQIRPRRRLTTDFVRRLPPNITDLEFGFFDGILDEMVPYLPKDLTRLALPTNNGISGEAFKLLPRSLIEVILPKNYYFTNHYMNLPDSVTKLAVFYDGYEISNVLNHFSRLSCLDVNGLQTLNKSAPSQHEHQGTQSQDSDEPGVLASFVDLLQRDSNLTSIKFTDAYHHSSFSKITRLNLNLVHLDLSTIEFKSELLFPHFPPHLQVLKLFWNTGTPPTISDEDILLLPRSLLVFRWMPLVIPPHTEEWRVPIVLPRLSVFCFHNLPSSLTDLALYAVDCIPRSAIFTKQFEQLPQTLRSLDIRVGIDGAPLITSLPPNLTKIRIRPRNAIDVGDETYWTSKVMNFKNLQIGWAREFRSTLTLRIGKRFSAIRELAFPPRLEYLSTGVALNVQQIHSLPQITLTCLEVTSECNWTNADIAQLPDCLKILIIGQDNQLDDYCIPSLPHFLQVLRLPRNTRMTGRLFPLPASLKDLTLGKCQRYEYSTLPGGLTRLSIRDAYVSDHTFVNMPKSLIDITFSETQRVTGEALPYMNPNAFRLALPQADFQDADMCQLPRFLCVLDISLGFGSLHDECLKELPRVLIALHFPGKWITDNGIPDLPRSLQRLVFVDPSSSLTSKCIPNLPRRLVYIDILSGKWKGGDGPAIRSVQLRDAFPHAKIVV